MAPTHSNPKNRMSTGGKPPRISGDAPTAASPPPARTSKNRTTKTRSGRGRRGLKKPVVKQEFSEFRDSSAEPQGASGSQTVAACDHNIDKYFHSLIPVDATPTKEEFDNTRLESAGTRVTIQGKLTQIDCGSGVEVTGLDRRKGYGIVREIRKNNQSDVWLKVHWWLKKRQLEHLRQQWPKSVTLKTVKPPSHNVGSRELIDLSRYVQWVPVSAVTGVPRLVHCSEMQAEPQNGFIIYGSVVSPSNLDTPGDRDNLYFARYKYCISEQRMVLAPEMTSENICPCGSVYRPDLKAVMRYCPSCDRSRDAREVSIEAEGGFREVTEAGLQEAFNAPIPDRLVNLLSCDYSDGPGVPLDAPADVLKWAERPITRGGEHGILGNWRYVILARAYVAAAKAGNLTEQDTTEAAWQRMVFNGEAPITPAPDLAHLQVPKKGGKRGEKMSVMITCPSCDAMI